MLRSKPVAGALIVLLLSLAGCGTEVISEESEEGNEEGKSGVAGDQDGVGGDEGDGEGGGEAADEDADGDEPNGEEPEDEEVVECHPDAIPPSMECCPGMTQKCWPDDQEMIDEFGDWDQSCSESGEWNSDDCDTPLVLSFDGSEPTMIAADAALAFDLAGDAPGMVTDWPRAETPWLVLDRDGDGRIGDGRELFGSGTRRSTGERAKNGFEALAELDADGSGVIDAADPGFASLALWSDRDADRATDASELGSIGGGARRVVAIDLDYRVEARCDARGNCGVERATFRWEDERGVHDGEVVDVHLRRR